MEAPELSSPAYWESEAVDVRLNPKRPAETEGLRAFLEGELGLRSAVVLATSGSGGVAKFVVLPKAALLASAAAVNAHCGLGRGDIWLGGLPTFHVGGLGIHARASLSGAKVAPMRWDAWTRDGGAFLRAVDESRATLASLTPTHLWDLARANAACPGSLRGVFLGGGRVDPGLVARARSLGWPIWPTYGMTETSSQVATALDGDGSELPLLPAWEARADAEGRLLLRGAPLFAGYAMRGEGGWLLDPSRDAEGWFRSGDRCELREGRLRFLARADGAVKVSGELVSLPSLDERLATLGIVGLVVALPEPRRGHELVLVCESEGDGAAELALLNAALPPIERATRPLAVAELPRTELGKPDRARALSLAEEAGARRSPTQPPPGRT
jgi:O-succinylbenzoic acid--CoA ligase